MQVPRSGGLLQSINGSKQLTDFLLLALGHETFWLHHIDALIKMAIQKGYLDVHLPYLVIETGSYGQENPNRLKDGYGRESFFIVHSLFLGITLCHEPCFESLYFPVDSSLFLEDPFASNAPDILRWIDKFPDGIGIHRFHFLVHCLQPLFLIRIIHCFIICQWIILVSIRY